MEPPGSVVVVADSGAAAGLVGARVARGHGLGRRDRRIDQRPALGREAVRQQARHGDEHEAAVGHVGVAVGERQRGGLELQVPEVGVRRAREVEALDDVERLPHGRPAAGRRAHPVDVVAEELAVRRRGREDLVAGEVVEGDQPRLPHLRCGGTGRRPLRRRDDLGRQRPGVEGVGTLALQQLVGPRQVAVAEARPDRGGCAAGQEELGGRRDLAEAGGVRLGLLGERRVDDEPRPGDDHGRLQRLRQGDRAVGLQCRHPGRERPRHPDRQSAVHGVSERQRLAGRGGDEDVRVERRVLRRLLAPVDRDHLAAWQRDDHEPAPADAGRVRLRHAQRGRCGDRGVHGVAAAPQYREARRSRVGVDRGHGAARALGDGHVRRGRRHGGRRQTRQHERGDQDPEGGEAAHGNPQSGRRRTRYAWTGRRGRVRRRDGCAPPRNVPRAAAARLLLRGPAEDASEVDGIEELHR